MKILAMFPGQGSQYVGMGKSILKDFPKAKLIFEEADDILKLSLTSLCFDGPSEELNLTPITQPAILTVSTAYWHILNNETEIKPLFFAGHSLGEYSALIAAKKLAFSEALTLVRARGLAMQEAVPVGIGSMAAILGFSTSRLEDLVKTLSLPQHFVGIANYNCPGQVVIAGHCSAVALVCKTVREEKGSAKTLSVSAPFHCELMKPAEEKMSPLLSNTLLKNNNQKIIANVSGTYEQNYQTDFLIRQICGSVMWQQSLEYAWQEECRGFLEIGPGRVLYGLAKKTLPTANEFFVSACEDDLPELIKNIKKIS